MVMLFSYWETSVFLFKFQEIREVIARYDTLTATHQVPGYISYKIDNADLTIIISFINISSWLQ